MVLTKKLIIIAMATSVLAGCTTMKRATGQIDDTKLPGQREDILPPDQQQARDPAVTGQPLPQDPNAIRVSNGQGAGQMPQQPGMAPQQQGIAPQQGGLYAAPPPAGMQNGVAPPVRGAARGAGQESITDNGAKTAGDCDPKVDLCPQVLRPEPLPPPSPLVPAKVAKAKEAKAAAANGATTVVKKRKLLKKKLPA
ncbi:MAG TPA: hypothetical protein VII21_07545, partial [Aestuariivirga sp.]